MIIKRSVNKMGKSNKGWLKSIFHFSFAEYHNPNNINFGPLRVINDDLVLADTGFGAHPHTNMEIISYVVEGELTHEDSMGNKHILNRGEVQYMSAGTGVQHSEYNYGNEILRFLQIWIIPDKNDYPPNYGDYTFKWEDRHNKWLHLVSGKEGVSPITIHRDFNSYVIDLDEGKETTFSVAENRQAYVVQIEGESTINDISMTPSDGLETIEESLTIIAKKKSHIIVLEMSAGK